MTRKTEYAIALLVILALIVLLLLVFWRNWEQPSTTQEAVEDETAVVDDGSTAETAQEVAAPPSPPSVTTVGRIFAERFGSYSTEADYENVDDVLSLATASFAQELEELAEDARKTKSSAYYGVSTHIIKVAVESSTDTTTTLLVKTQREEAFDTPGNTSVRYQDMRVELVKEGDTWLVDGFTWL